MALFEVKVDGAGNDSDPFPGSKLVGGASLVQQASCAFQLNGFIGTGSLQIRIPGNESFSGGVGADSWDDVATWGNTDLGKVFAFVPVPNAEYRVRNLTGAGVVVRFA